MAIAAIRIYQIDTHNSKVVPVDKDQYGVDFDNYLNGLIEIIAKGSGRNFVFDRETTEVRALIPRISAKEDFSMISEIAAQRLLSCEQTTQKNIEKLNVEIQKGIVVQAIIEDDSQFKYVICKADHTEFLKDDDYKLTKGLPIKKKVFKAFVCTFSSLNVIESVLVYDTNAKMSKYWWKDFLELVEVYTDKHNTTTAFDAIDKGVFTKMKKESPQDYVHLRNSVVRYFRAKEIFDMEDFLENAIGDYQPYNQKVNIEKLKDSIKELAQTKKFDERFSIIREEIKAKFLSKIPLTSQIDLHLKEDITNIDNVIKAVKGKDGIKYVQIQSESGYNYFNKPKQ